MIRGIVDVIGVDPRVGKWELDAPAYRVYFHDASGASDEDEFVGADVEAVLLWAEDNRGARSFVLYVCVPGDGMSMVRLVKKHRTVAADSDLVEAIKLASRTH